MGDSKYGTASEARRAAPASKDIGDREGYHLPKSIKPSDKTDILNVIELSGWPPLLLPGSSLPAPVLGYRAEMDRSVADIEYNIMKPRILNFN